MANRGNDIYGKWQLEKMAESSLKSDNKKKLLFTNRQLFMLLWPLVVEQLLNVLVGMVDVVMVSSIGEAAVSGVSLVDALNQLLIQFLAALTTGGAVVCSQYIGMQNRKKANQSAAQLIFITVVGAVVLAAGFLCSGTFLLKLVFGKVEADVMHNAYIYYMITACSFPFLALYNSGAALFRSMGNSAVSMRTSILMNGMNVFGNALCIFVLKMGVAGVAIPTLISRAVASLILFTLLQNPKNAVRVEHIRDMRPEPVIIKRILTIGIPGGIENSLFHCGRLMLQSLVATLGTASIAGFAVANNLVTFLYLPGNALGMGLTTVVGQCVGAREAEQARSYINKFLMINYSILVVLATTLGAGRFFWIGFYNLSPEGVAIAGGLVLGHSIAMTIWPLGFLIPHAFRASNDIRFTMVTSISCMWIFRVGLSYVFVKHMGLSIQWVWYAMYIDWIVRIIIYQIRLRGFTERVRKLQL